MSWLLHYWLFVLELLTALIVFGGFVLLFVVIRRALRSGQNTDLEGAPPQWEILVTSLNQEFQDYSAILEEATFSEKDAKAQKKLRNKEKKAQKKQSKKEKNRLFVLDFEGDTGASAAQALQEEVTAIVHAKRTGDRVLVRLESPGGSVNDYGYAAGQLQRLRDAGIPLVAAVDRVAASGGYLMAAVANEIIASPFAYVGSIGVVSVVPNFHKLLKTNDVDVDYYTAGNHKRSVTMFGENTEEGRKKYLSELSAIHEQFKAVVARFRPSIDIQKVATGEFWLAESALSLGLVDRLQLSSDYILKATIDGTEVYHIAFCQRKALRRNLGKLFSQMSRSLRKPLQLLSL